MLNPEAVQGSAAFNAGEAVKSKREVVADGNRRGIGKLLGPVDIHLARARGQLRRRQVADTCTIYLHCASPSNSSVLKFAGIMSPRAWTKGLYVRAD